MTASRRDRPPASLFAPDEPPPVGYARLALERSIDHPGGLTYAIPATLRSIRVGDLVEAPLGSGDRAERGVVIELTTEPPADVPAGRLKPVTRRVGPGPPPALVALARWIASYYCCPLGMVLSTMVPAAVKKRVGSVRRRAVEPTGAEPVVKLPPKTRAAWDAVRGLERGVFPAEPRALAASLGLRSVGPVNRLVEAGLLREREVVAVRALFDTPLPASAPIPEPTAEQAAAVGEIVGALGKFERFLLFGVTGSGKTEVYLRAIEEALSRGRSALVLVPEISLTPQTAGRFVSRFGAERIAVLHSGLTAAQRHHEWDRIARGSARVAIGARSAVFAPFPSADGSGDPAPPGSLGIIIVDEEHDASYKQDQLPRYHARDVAVKRAQLEGCPIVLGSATPSLESWRHVDAGQVKLLPLRERVGGGRLPRVRIVDLAEERRERKTDDHRLHSIGPTLEHELRGVLDGGGQAILLLNRRGYASYIHCPSCQWLLTCDYCDVTTVYHKRSLPVGAGGGGGSEVASGAGDARSGGGNGGSGGGSGGGYVKCHHCLAETRLPPACPDCGARLALFGPGTQRLEEELARKFPELAADRAVLRLDSDTMRGSRDYFSSLDRFARGEVRLLLGTQMIAKGLDFPNVRLIGVVSADTALFLPDFRAAERTFQLIAQVAGRAGRSAASADARVVVQTMNPSEPSIVAASRHDYVGFAERELKIRSASGLPPAGRMARLVFRDRDFDAAAAAADRAAAAIRDAGAPGLRLHGPAPCALSRIDEHHRVGLDLIAPSAGPIQRALTHLRNNHQLKSDARVAVDVDPVSLL